MQHKSRVDWVDYAKGFCIVMVVMMHSTLGVEKAAEAEGWMHYLVAWATPFRMPDFFLISGLFLARVIDRDWRTYLDKKVVHFVYFYVLWLTIQFVFKAPGIAAEEGVAGAAEAYLMGFIEPFGTLWFIYLLPVFFVISKAVHDSRIPWWTVWIVGAVLEALPVTTGWTLIDEFCSRFVYFYTGFIFAPTIFKVAVWALEKSGQAGAFLAVWAVGNGILVFTGWSTVPGVSVALGLLGAGAVVTFCALLSKIDMMAPLKYLGEHSIVVYLAFFLPMAASREVLLRYSPIQDLGTISVIVTACGVIFPVLLYWAVKNNAGRFLFERPRWASLRSRTLAPAE